MSGPVDEADEMANDTVATGALLMLLHVAGGLFPEFTSARLTEGGTPNQIDVTFNHLESPYRITVERVTEPITSVIDET